MPLTEQQAFAAMFRFLNDYWERNGRPDEVAMLLGSLNPDLTRDGWTGRPCHVERPAHRRSRGSGSPV